jgi:hypothetical protein
VDEVVVGWQAAAAASKRTESWLRRHLDLTGGTKNDDGVWEFPVKALERLRPDGADVGDDDTEVVTIRSGTAEPDDTEVVRISTEPPTPATAVQTAPAVAAVDERGIPATTFALVFAALDAKKRISEIVQEHVLLPDDVEWIAQKWRRVNAADLNSSAIPALIAKLATRIAALENRLHDTVEAHNALADTVDPQGGADAPARAAEDVDLPARVEKLMAAVDEIREFLAGFVPAVMLRRDIAGVVRDKLLLLLPLALQRTFGGPVPPGTSDYYGA